MVSISTHHREDLYPTICEELAVILLLLYQCLFSYHICGTMWCFTFCPKECSRRIGCNEIQWIANHDVHINSHGNRLFTPAVCLSLVLLLRRGLLLTAGGLNWYSHRLLKRGTTEYRLIGFKLTMKSLTRDAQTQSSNAHFPSFFFLLLVDF